MCRNFEYILLCKTNFFQDRKMLHFLNKSKFCVYAVHRGNGASLCIYRNLLKPLTMTLFIGLSIIRGVLEADRTHTVVASQPEGFSCSCSLLYSSCTCSSITTRPTHSPHPVQLRSSGGVQPRHAPLVRPHLPQAGGEASSPCPHERTDRERPLTTHLPRCPWATASSPSR